MKSDNPINFEALGKYDMSRLTREFFSHDAVTVAQKLIGKTLVRVFEDGMEVRYPITITEAYMGGQDLACHASKGKTPRTSIMFEDAGHVYVYLIYGMYWMLNFVTGAKDDPQAVLICGMGNIVGSGRVGRELKLNKDFYGEDLQTSERIWVEDSLFSPEYQSVKRVGVEYAGEWKEKLWRFEATSP